MTEVLKYTYLLDVPKIKKALLGLWRRYQLILDDPNWADLNEARAILYYIGFLYPEKIAEGAIERRLHLLQKPMTLLEFYQLIDRNSKKLEKYREDKLFAKLEKFYILVKEFKNKNVGGRWYLDEERFVNVYNQYCPKEELKIRERGKFKINHG